jgi:RimJ/RimL family protein N-acetyltransferase
MTQQPQAATIERPVIIPGERIFLSHVHREDVDLFASWFADLELTTYLGAVGMAFTAEHERDWIERTLREAEGKTFAIIVRETQQPIGSVSLMEINHRHGVATLGIAIGDKAAWGRGYGSEAVRLICDYGFTFLNLYHIRLWHFAFNERGHRAYLKAGFREAGRLRGTFALNGRRYDEILMEITREEFGPSNLIGMLQQIQE